MSPAPLVVLGCGFTGAAAAVAARAEGRRVVATVRTDREALRPLRALGVEVVVAPALTADQVASLARGADLLVTLPPDGSTDASIAPQTACARASVYLSSTGVYGRREGRIDEDTELDAREPGAAARLRAEDAWRAAGATVLRAAGIYGPGRGLHRRLIDGVHRLPGDGSRVVSRIHVDDLAGMALACLAHGLRAETFVAADDAPVPQIEVVRALASWLRLPLPPSVPLHEVPETLRTDRAVINVRMKRATGIALRYPTWREGFAQCLAAEGVPFTA